MPELRRFFELCGTHEPLLSSSRSERRLPPPPLAVATGGDRVPGPSSAAAADWSSVRTTAPPLVVLLCPPLISGGGGGGEQKRLKPASMALTEKRSCVTQGRKCTGIQCCGSGSGRIRIRQHSTRSSKRAVFSITSVADQGCLSRIPDPNNFSIADPGSALKNSSILTQKNCFQALRKMIRIKSKLIWDFHSARSYAKIKSHNS